MKYKKHILILTPGFPESDNDTTCIPPLQVYVKELHRRHGRELQISVLAFQYPFRKGDYLWEGINCWSAGGNNHVFPRKARCWIDVFTKAYKLHKQNPFSVIHSFWLHDCTLIGQWLASVTGAHHIAHAMGQDVLRGNKYLKWLNRGKMHIVANSPVSKRWLFENYNITASDVVPFGLNPDDFEPFTSHSRNIDLLSVGSLTPVKNQMLFIELFAEVKKKFPALKGVIIGEGILYKELQNAINRLDLKANLILAGKKNRRDVLLQMSYSKILLHTAPFESAAYVFLEALYSGMHVVSFQTGLLPCVRNAHPCDSKAEMFQTIIRLLSENVEQERMEVPFVADTVAALYAIYNRG